MTREPEQILEDNLVQQLMTLGHSFVPIKDEAALVSNLKTQLEKHNNVKLSDKDFQRVLNHLNKGNVFERAKILRDRFQLTKEDGESVYLSFLNSDNWLKNEFQVTQQVTIEGKYKNRYDVTLLVNGLPLVQIELKRRGLELKEAFNQTNRYHKHSYAASHGLFQYIQIFVISNGVNTKYYANNRKQSFKQTFYWSDFDNKNISGLEDFANAFLNAAHIGKMLAKYIVLNETDKVLMVLRPYQYYATEAIIDRVKNSTRNGYIWHTTGSGKTLTSFKTSQILTKLPEIEKVCFVVDRKDLDYQTIKEFNSFSKGSVDSTDDTNTLVSQLSDDTKLIVTTLQKLNTAISKTRYKKKIEHLVDKKMVFIFDECHRSQFGETHKKITEFFKNHQLFGFTGTPIFPQNAIAKNSIKHITKELFHDRLHSYVITDAIKDENVLRFAIEYFRFVKEKKTLSIDEEKVEDIDTKEVLESPVRLDLIADYIIANHKRKTHDRKFTSIFCVSSIDILIKYYEIFQRKKADGEHNLKVATIFTYSANEEDEEADGFVIPAETEYQLAAEEAGTYGSSHTRDKLEKFIGDYNDMFGTKYSTKDSESFYNYYKDIGKRIKDMEKVGNDPESNIDILLVVSMFLTGFDGKLINTLYVDKNLKHHGLIQAYSRTNRIINETKSHGNIVVFRNLKKATDDAITLFSTKEAKEEIIIPPYEEFVKKFNERFIELLKLTPTVQSVDDLPSEDEELQFVQLFRELIRMLNVLKTFTQFSWDDLAMNEQQFEDYKSKYIDLFEKVKFNKTEKYKESILDDVDFEIELIHRDEVNVAYILKLLRKLKATSESQRAKQEKQILDMLSNEVTLRSKRELIKKFIQENLPQLEEEDDVEEAFNTFWKIERNESFEKLCEEEKIVPMKLEELIGNYLFTGRQPIKDEIIDTLETKPRVLEMRKVADRVSTKIFGFIETFISGMAG
ncbi:type I restriction endonuclease subunit R [Ekhidna sp.]|uniref:type I restriction endonuclease subunit R n=1 Tax=Ekhidna sp. TaxID=2608089 RepID=UPI003B5C82CB